jgi:hypothetical protein
VGSGGLGFWLNYWNADDADFQTQIFADFKGFKMKYLLLLGEYSTGHILHTDGKTIFHNRYENNSVLPCIIFSNIDDAEKEAQAIVENDPSIEVVLYTENDEIVKTVRGNFVAPKVVKDRWWKFW